MRKIQNKGVSNTLISIHLCKYNKGCHQPIESYIEYESFKQC